MLQGIAAVTCLALVAWHVTGAQESKPQGSCRRPSCRHYSSIDAGIRRAQRDGRLPLLNDSETAQSIAPESWKIVIDGKELSDSDWIFGNGPGPVGGYGTLAAGATFDFGKALPIARYFPETREYRISWKARYFQSPTVTVRIPTSKH